MTPTPPFDPATFIPQFDAAARRAGFTAEPFGEIHGYALNAYTKLAAPDAPRLYVSSGMHGDEPAPPWAVLELVERGFFDSRASWWICPILNPTGLALGKRENFAGVDLNRDYKQPASAEIRAHVAWLERQPDFHATFCLHEDYEAQGFYLYELNPEQRPTLADAALAGAARHCPIEHAAVIDGREAAAPGIIRPVSDPLLREQWPEAIYLRHQHTPLTYTFESPTMLPLPARVAAHCAALRAAVDALLTPSR
ncbi:M14 family metallocarboxypeptidase [Oleiharenicola sp. Vm1]|uniref:M14 family metallopeptidase n=1 Tax=Oleiharenicola sp. Vm1 TaxID=3398393 RepID=UPI0039F5761D